MSATFSIVSQVYIVSTIVGSGFMIVSTLLGRIPRHGSVHAGGHVHGGGHGGGLLHGGHDGAGHGLRIGHSGGGHGSVGHGSAAGHGAAAHGGAVGSHGGSGVAGHGAGASHGAAGGHGTAPGSHGSAPGSHGGAPGSHGGAPGNHGSAPGSHGGAHAGSAGHGASGASVAVHSGTAGPASGQGADIGNPMATTGPIVSEPAGIITRALSKVHGLHVELKEESLLESLLGLLNPLSIATFLTFFGLTGVIVSIGFKLPEIVSLPLAGVAGWLAVQLVVHTIAWLFETMGSSSEARMEDLVGRMAEVTVPIGTGKVGEITYIIKSKRYASPAKAVDSTQPLTKRTKVMISEVQDHLMLVEPWTDSFIDPSFDSAQNLQT
ncbi:MAG TPA: hypothetical protein V6C86_06270 [Oculatellaceae cyanobacterium]